jgi:adenine specific DNA methylase Mod
MTKQQKFFGALREVFVGAKVEGESGYINLMRIKARYYEKGVFPKLQQDINEALKPFPDFREELFDKLYTFFSRYFSESGSIYFRYTPLHQNVYEKVYTDDKDVMLFWKTHMLYYVKTDRLFRNLEVEQDGTKFFFDVSTLEHKKANEKRNIVYSFKEKRKDTLVFEAAYSERGRKTNVDEILRTLRKQEVNLSEDKLERAFRVFEKQSEVDYFINKDAKAFLEEQFNLWLYQYVFSGESEWTETRIKQLQTLKAIAFKIIAFISQFENELVKIWNKPKFVLDSNYVITLDRIAEKDMALVEKLLAHKNFKAQIEEWKQLGMVDDSFKKTAVLEKDLMGKRLAKPYQHLPIDTKHFKDVELEILELFDNLDQELDGWLIKSENFRALNTIQSKFREKVRCIYIDPPYNTGSDEFIYRDRFQHSSWLSMMADRVTLARTILQPQGLFFSSIDFVEVSKFRLLLDEVFGATNFLADIAWEKRYTRSNNAKLFYSLKDTILTYRASDFLTLLREARTEKADANYSNPDKDSRGPWISSSYVNPATKEERPNLVYAIKNPYTGKKIEHPTHAWKYEYDVHVQHVEEKRLYWGEHGEYKYPRLKGFLSEMADGLVPVDVWRYSDTGTTDEGGNELKALFGGEVFENPKPTRLIKRMLDLAHSETQFVTLDFFAGSGSTAHAVINYNRDDGSKRKYIIVETGNWFDSVILPRIKKVVFCEKWKNGKAEGGKGVSHFAKYCQLEQYENTLRRVKYDEADLFDDPNQDPYHQYVFLRDLKMLEALEVDTAKNKVKVDLSKLYDGIDIAETLSNLTGKWIKRITADSIEFEDGEVVNMKNLDWKRIKPLIWW